MKTRRELIQVLADFAGPLGPFRALEEMEERRSAWLDGLRASDLPALLDLLRSPPAPAEYSPATADDFELELTDAVTAAAAGDPEPSLALMTPLIQDDRARGAVIDVIGGLQLARGLELLAPLVIDARLTSDERVRLACALGDIGGDDARALLRALQTRSDGESDVLAEIDIALQRTDQRR
jgi:hypothetical protein